MYLRVGIGSVVQSEHYQLKRSWEFYSNINCWLHFALILWKLIFWFLLSFAVLTRKLSMPPLAFSELLSLGLTKVHLKIFLPIPERWKLWCQCYYIFWMSGMVQLKLLLSLLQNIALCKLNILTCLNFFIPWIPDTNFKPYSGSFIF